MFSKPTVIVYLRRNNLVITGKKVSPSKLELDSLINNMEIADQENFVSTVSEFVKSKNIGSRKVLVILDGSIVFYKQLNLESKSKADIDAAVNDFVSMMPFNPGQRAFVQVQIGDKLEIYATNADLFYVLKESLKNGGVRKLVSISPSAAFKLDSNMKAADAIDQYLADKNVHGAADFLQAAVV